MSKKSLTINAVRDGKKVAKSVGFVNPDVANSLVGGFAQMLNALSNDTFVNSQVVKVMDTTEEDSGGGSAPAPAPAKQEGIITWVNHVINYNGDGTLYRRASGTDDAPVTIQSGSSWSPGKSSYSLYLFATPTDNFTAAAYVKIVNNTTPD